MTLATGYHARARPLWEKAVDTAPLQIEVLPFRDDGGRHLRFLDGEFDAAELSLALYLDLKSRGAPIVALPVFPNRRFRHASIFVRADSPIQKPEDLKGKAAGVPSYVNTCGLWVRGFLSDDYGVRPGDILWKAMRPDPGFVPPDGVAVEILKGKKGLAARLLDGELDAIISPDGLLLREPGIRRLFASSKEIEKDYYARTGIFPVSHAVALRRRFLDEHPWAAQKLFDIWSEAKRVALEDDADPTYSNFAWIQDLWQEESALFGPDAWPYGLARNRLPVAALCRYAVEQGILRSGLEPDSLFHPIQE